MWGELARGAALPGSIALVEGTLVGLVRALLCRASCASLALAGNACAALLAFMGAPGCREAGAR